MAKLVLLVVAAAWAAVLIPPMLRSRAESRPNSSVTDFRRQLSTLQGTSSSHGGMRTIGRPLAQSPLQRPAAAGRPGRQHAHHRQASLHGTPAAPTRTPSRHVDARAGQFRSHGDPTVDHERPHRQTHMDRHATRTQRRPSPRNDVRRRRTNVLFLLLVSSACTLFLAATTSSTVMLYAFALSFLALCGYIYLLTQMRQRDAAGWNDGWFEGR